MALKRRRQESPSATMITRNDEATNYSCSTAVGHPSGNASSVSLLLIAISCLAARPCDAFVVVQPAALLSPSIFSSSPAPRVPKAPLRSSLTLDRQTLTECWDKHASKFKGLSPITIPRDPEWNIETDLLVGNQDVPTTCNLEGLSPTTVEPSTHTSPATSAGNISTTLKLWKRRLVTREDWKHMHKITGGLFLLSSWGLTGYALRDLLAHGWTQPVTSHGKPFLALLLVLLGSSVVQSFSSIRLACHHRRGQPAVRNTFLCNAAVAILGSVSALWSSPWYPTCLNGAFSLAFYFIMDAIGLIGMGDNLVRLKALIASRQTTNKHNGSASNTMTRLQYWKDVFIYMMPILIGAPFFVAIGWQFGIQHDRTFYLNLLQRLGHPHLEAGAVYAMIMVAMGASYSSLIVTLRDKKLIRKRTEGLSLTAIMVCLSGRYSGPSGRIYKPVKQCRVGQP